MINRGRVIKTFLFFMNVTIVPLWALMPVSAQAVNDDPDLAGIDGLRADLTRLKDQAIANNTQFESSAFPNWTLTYRKPLDVGFKVTLSLSPPAAFKIEPNPCIVDTHGVLPKFTISVADPKALISPLRNVRVVHSNIAIGKIENGQFQIPTEGTSSCTVQASWHGSSDGTPYNLNDLKATHKELKISIDPPGSALDVGVNVKNPTKEDFERIKEKVKITATLSFMDEDLPYASPARLKTCAEIAAEPSSSPNTTPDVVQGNPSGLLPPVAQQDPSIPKSPVLQQDPSVPKSPVLQQDPSVPKSPVLQQDPSVPKSPVLQQDSPRISPAPSGEQNARVSPPSSAEQDPAALPELQSTNGSDNRMPKSPNSVITTVPVQLPSFSTLTKNSELSECVGCYLQFFKSKPIFKTITLNWGHTGAPYINIVAKRIDYNHNRYIDANTRWKIVGVNRGVLKVDEDAIEFVQLYPSYNRSFANANGKESFTVELFARAAGDTLQIQRPDGTPIN